MYFNATFIRIHIVLKGDNLCYNVNFMVLEHIHII